MIVPRTDRDLFLALIVGALRTVDSRNGHRPQRYGAGGAGMDRDLVGAIGEQALASTLDRSWPGPTGPDDGNDVGGVGVRSTVYPTGQLLLHPGDADDRAFVLAIVDLEGKRVRIVGWILGRDGKHPDYWVADGRPCYWVPQDALDPNLDGLREWVDR